MTKKQNLFKYDVLDRLLKKSHAIINASELHGILVALICVSDNNISKCQKIILNVLSLKKNHAVVMRFINELYKYNLDQIKDTNNSVSIIVPEDLLTIKVKLLKVWLQGFISGLGLIGYDWDYKRQKVIKEILHDFLMITYTNDNVKKEDEVYYTNILEYVKTSVEIIYFEIYDSSKKS